MNVPVEPPDRMPTFNDVMDAASRIAPYVAQTPTTFSPALSSLTGYRIFIKWDCKLPTGSFKERGVANLLHKDPELHRRQGVWAGSAGNHALALSYHARELTIPCHIVMPTTAPLVKLESVRARGADVIQYGEIFDEAYQHAQKLAAARHGIFVPGFDHPDIIAGQGTAGLEILTQVPDVDTVVVPVGGGGLMAGIALAVKARAPHVQLCGVRSQWVIDAQRPHSSPIPLPLRSRSVADGIAVKTIGSLTSRVMQGRVDSMLPVSEDQISHAIMRYLELEHTVVEGAGAAALAAVLGGQLPECAHTVVVLACGSNIDLNVVARLIERDMAERNRLIRLSISVPDRPGALHTLTGLIAGHHANVLQVYHDRSSSRMPGNVTISFLLEVRDQAHGSNLVGALRALELEVVVHPPHHGG